MSNVIEIYTDGACRGNPGPGGWGVLLRYKNTEKELYGGEDNTTNNRMELMAAICGLEALKPSQSPRPVILVTDSNYVKRGMTEWLPNWKRRQWKTAGNKPVQNQDLWQRLDAATRSHSIDWQWVKGHSGHPDNERADRLANRGIDELLAEL